MTGITAESFSIFNRIFCNIWRLFSLIASVKLSICNPSFIANCDVHHKLLKRKLLMAIVFILSITVLLFKKSHTFLYISVPYRTLCCLRYLVIRQKFKFRFSGTPVWKFGNPCHRLYDIYTNQTYLLLKSINPLCLLGITACHTRTEKYITFLGFACAFGL